MPVDRFLLLQRADNRRRRTQPRPAPIGHPRSVGTSREMDVTVHRRDGLQRGRGRRARGGGADG